MVFEYGKKMTRVDLCEQMLIVSVTVLTIMDGAEMKTRGSQYRCSINNYVQWIRLKGFT